MDQQQKCVTGVEFPDGISGPDPIPLGTMTVVADLRGATNRRTKAELQEQIGEIQADSIAELCDKAKVRIEGTYTGSDGKPVHVSIPVVDETTFTPDGLTRGDPGLLELFTSSIVCDAAAEYLDQQPRDYFTDEEIAQLTQRLALLEAAKMGGAA